MKEFKRGGKNQKLIKKQIIFVLSVICILLMSWFGSMYWVTGEVALDFGKKYTLDFHDNEDIVYNIKDLKVVDEDTFKSKSKDSYIVAGFSENVKISDIFLDITLKNKAKTANCQIFYATGDEKFSGNHTVRKEITSGENLIQIERGSYDKIRIDFVDEKGVKFDVNKLQLCENYIPDDLIWIFIIVSVLLTGMMSLLFWGYTIKNMAYCTMVQKWYGLSTRQRRLIQVMIASSITLLIVFGRIVYSNQIMAYGDIGSDTLKQYLPQYNLIVNKLRSGNLSLWLPEVGFGYNIGHFFIFSPFLIMLFILGVIFGNAAIPALVILYRVAVILLCAYFAFRFLEKFSDNYNVIAIGAYMYAFNGFAIVWGQHYVFFEYPLYTIVVFYLVERFLQGRNKRFDLTIILVSFMSMTFSVYMSYMIYLPAGVYAVIRYIYMNDKFKIKEFVCAMFNLALNIIIGFIGGLSIGLLYVKNILASGRAGGNASKLSKFFEILKSDYLSDDFLGSLQRFLSGNLSGIGSKHQGLHNYYEEPQIFFSVIFLVVLIQFIFTAHKTSKSKRQIFCKYIGVVLVGLAIFNKGVLFALYAFSQDARRTVFALYPVFVIMVVCVLDNIFRRKIISRIGLVVGTIATLIVMLYNINDFLDVDKKVLLAVSIVTLIIAVVVFLCADRKNQKIVPKWCIIALAMSLFCNITSEMYVSVNRIGIADRSALQDTGIKSDTREAIEYLESIDASYYRVDKTYTAWNEFTDSYFVNYKAISSYNAMMTNYMRSYNELFMNPLYLSIVKYKPCFILAPNDIVQYSSLGLKYILSQYELPDDKHYELLKQIGDVYVYKNLTSDSFTTFFDDVVLKSEFVKLKYNDRNIIQQKALVIEDEDADMFSERIKSTEQILREYKEEDLTGIVSVNGNDISKLFNTKIDKSREIVFASDWVRDNVENLFLEMVVKPTGNGKVNIYFDTGNGYNNNEKYQMLCNEAECQIRYVIPNDVKKIKLDFSSVPSELVDFKISKSTEEIKNSDNPSRLNDKESNSRISGDITCDRAGILYIPVPYDSNWKIKVDGIKAKIYVANTGFCAINISEGYHKIEMVYEVKELKLGMICLSIAGIMAIIYYFVDKRYTNGDKNEEVDV